MNRSTRKSFAIIEPHGNGGIAHYTFELASALAAAAVPIVLYTADRYELFPYRPRFEVRTGLGSSFLKRVLVRRIFPRGRRRVAGNENSGKPPRASKERQASSSKFHRYIFRLSSSVRSIYLQTELLLLLLLRGVRLIHLQWPWPQRHPMYLVRLARLCRLRVVCTAHNVLPHDDESAPTIRFFNGWYKAMDLIVVHSRSSAEALERYFSIGDRKIAVIPHGNYDFFPRSRTDRDSARKELRIDQGSQVVLFFGNIREYKGLEVLIRAFKAARKENPNLFLLIAGKVVPFKNKDHGYYLDLIAPLKAGADFLFEDSYVPIEKVTCYFSAADVVALPYVKTYSSGILHLAYSFSKPVIATATGDLAEAVVQNESGLIVPPQDADSLAKAILAMFSPPGRCEEMGKAGRRLAGTVYSWDSIAQQTKAAYLALCDSKDALTGRRNLV